MVRAKCQSMRDEEKVAAVAAVPFGVADRRHVHAVAGRSDSSVMPAWAVCGTLDHVHGRLCRELRPSRVDCGCSNCSLRINREDHDDSVHGR